MRTVPITLNKKKYRLKYTWGALRWLKDTHNLLVGSLDLLPEDWTLFSPWLLAGLRHEHEDLTVKDIDDMVDITLESVLEVHGKINEAMGLSQANDVPKEEPANPPSNPRTSTGVASSALVTEPSG